MFLYKYVSILTFNIIIATSMYSIELIFMTKKYVTLQYLTLILAKFGGC